jgi:hypothetical protein
MKWIMEIKVGGSWVPISMKDKPPYAYKTREEADHMLRICYPDQVRNQRLSGEELTRVREVPDEEKTYDFSS